MMIITGWFGSGHRSAARKKEEKSVKSFILLLLLLLLWRRRPRVVRLLCNYDELRGWKGRRARMRRIS
jgi:hypothetical protein